MSVDAATAYFDRYGLANTSGEKHAQRKVALADARGEVANIQWRLDVAERAVLHVLLRRHEYSHGCDGCLDAQNILDASMRESA